MFKKIKDKMNNKKGFTLVELIVVIVIILILAAVLVPNVMKYISKAGQANAKQDAATMLTQVQADVADAYAESVQKGEAFVAPSVTLGKVTVTSGDGTNANTYKLGTDNSTVEAFAYNNTSYLVTWTKTNGWAEPVKQDAAKQNPAGGGND